MRSGNLRKWMLAVLPAAMSIGSPASAAAADVMPAAEQNAVVKRHCAVCHTDAAKNGGLSLEHYDAANAAPSLSAMLLSKVTGGVALETLNKAATDPAAAEMIAKKANSGALAAAGIRMPDKTTTEALIRAFTAQSARATEWSIERDTASGAALTASILREAPSKTAAGEAEAYRLVIVCNPSTQEGYMQLAWSPVAQSGTFQAAVDGKAPVEFRVAGSEKMGNGKGRDLDKLAAVLLSNGKGSAGPSVPFPAESLTVRDLFPGESVTFPFAGLDRDARQQLRACF